MWDFYSLTNEYFTRDRSLTLCVAELKREQMPDVTQKRTRNVNKKPAKKTSNANKKSAKGQPPAHNSPAKNRSPAMVGAAAEVFLKKPPGPVSEYLEESDFEDSEGMTGEMKITYFT